MSDQNRRESNDLGDYQVDDPYDTLDQEPGDPLDRGVAPPERWSAAARSGSIAPESLAEQLAEEEPDLRYDEYDEDDGPDPRAGRLVAPDEGAHPDTEDELHARDAGIDGGAASAEEAAVHVVDDDDTDIRSDR